MTSVAISIVAPAHNEAGNVEPLVNEVGAAGARLGEMLDGGFEFVLVDDGSTDDTRARALAMCAERPWLRVIANTNTPQGKGNGQSAAFHTGFRACRGERIAVLDADLQNDPADLVPLLEQMLKEDADVAQGDRSRTRQDHAIRKWGSSVGRAFRRSLLGDTVRDTGCSLRIMKREVALALPLEFKGIHRFIPAISNDLGYKVVEREVSHRPRTAGETKYGMGITKRAIPGLLDLLAVRWMRARRRPITYEDVTPGGTP